MKKPSSPAKALAAGIVVGATVGIATVTFVGAWEGKRNSAYLDIGGVPTVCRGHTGPDIEMRLYSDEECELLLRKDLQLHVNVMMRYIKVPLSEGEMTAYSSLVFNIGVGLFRSSDLLEFLNAGQREAACKQLLRFVKVKINGVFKVIRGLQRRRAAEYELCSAKPTRLA